MQLEMSMRVAFGLTGMNLNCMHEARTACMTLFILPVKWWMLKGMIRNRMFEGVMGKGSGLEGLKQGLGARFSKSPRGAGKGAAEAG